MQIKGPGTGQAGTLVITMVIIKCAAWDTYVVSPLHFVGHGMRIDDTVKVQVHSFVYGVRVQAAAESDSGLWNICDWEEKQDTGEEEEKRERMNRMLRRFVIMLMYDFEGSSN